MILKKLIPTYKKPETKTFTYTFTVFTPVFNAQTTLLRVYQSLLKQTFKDFEWLIINDGSTDDSHEVITEIIKDSKLKINYVNNPINQHKMGCFLQAINLADGSFFLTFDADDECTANALEKFKIAFDSIPNDLKESTVAVTGLCVDQNGILIGNKFPKQPYYSTPFESYYIDKVSGEKWGLTKTNALLGIKNSEFLASNGYIPESLIWNLLGKEGYVTSYINEQVRIYYTDTKGSISGSSFDKTAFGFVILYIANFNWFFKKFAFKTPVFFLKNLYFLLRFSNYTSFTLKNYTTSLDSCLIKFLFVLLWPFRKLTM